MKAQSKTAAAPAEKTPAAAAAAAAAPAPDAAAPAAPAAPVAAPVPDELIARIGCYERLKLETEKQSLALREKISALEEDLFKQICPQTDLAANGRLAPRLRAHETSASPLTTELALLERFSALLTRRIDEFVNGRCDLMLLAYGRRLEELNARHVKEQAEADAVKVEMRRLEERIAECEKRQRARKQAPAKA